MGLGNVVVSPCNDGDKYVQGIGTQAAAVELLPKAQKMICCVAPLFKIVPALHDMLQLAPCAKVPSEEQLPRLPLVGADSPVQLAGSHTTELDTVPALHDGC